MHRAKDDDFTVLLNRAAAGDDGATHAVWEQSYGEMLMVASSMRPASSADSVHAPSPATILHESFFKTFRPAHANTVTWDSRAHFFGSVSRAMGQFVIDWRRAASRKKRGGGTRALEFDQVGQEALSDQTDDLTAALDRSSLNLELANALCRLRARAPNCADVVCLRYMAGLSLEDTARVLGIRPRTVSKRWNFGRALLRLDLLDHAPAGVTLPESSTDARIEPTSG